MKSNISRNKVYRIYKSLTSFEKELEQLNKKEEKYKNKKIDMRPSPINKKLEDIVPDKLQETLDITFYKAFELIFEKGLFLIEKTYNKEKIYNNHNLHSKIYSGNKNRRNFKNISKHSVISKNTAVLFSGIEGTVLGALGIGIPDIPVFVSVMLRSIYEIAASFGYNYETESEQIFILKLINAAMLNGDEFLTENSNIDYLIYNSINSSCDKKEQIKITANSMSKEMLYMKFIQGIPVAGIIGGASNYIYINKITDYALLKYKKRFLNDKINHYK